MKNFGQEDFPTIFRQPLSHSATTGKH